MSRRCVGLVAAATIAAGLALATAAPARAYTTVYEVGASSDPWVTIGGSSWTSVANGSASAGAYAQSPGNNAAVYSATLTFVVVSGEEATVSVAGVRSSAGCAALEVVLDGGSPTTVSEAGSSLFQHVMYTSGTLGSGEHSLMVRKPQGVCVSSNLWVDFFRVVSSASATTTTTAATTTTTAGTTTTTSGGPDEVAAEVAGFRAEAAVGMLVGVFGIGIVSGIKAVR